MWLSGLHIPESYLTALVQAACRKNGWPLDLSTLYTKVTQYSGEEEVPDRPGNGNDSHGIVYNDAEKVMVVVVPSRLLHLRPVSGGSRLGHGEWMPGEEQTQSSGCSTSHPQSHPHRVLPLEFTGEGIKYAVKYWL